MTPEEILAETPRVLSRGQRESYFQNGYLLVEALIDPEWLERLRAVTAAFVTQSRSLETSDDLFDLAPGHGPYAPRIRRIKTPDSRHPLYWDFACGVIADVAADLLGPDVVFHHSKLNFKWHEGGDGVRWHQDIQFYPHTNYSPLTIGAYLSDTGPEDGARSRCCRRATRGPSTTSTTARATGPGRSRTRTLPGSTGTAPSFSPVRPARSPCTTAARCTARRPARPTTAGRCC